MKYAFQDLVDLGTKIFLAAGLNEEKAESVSRLLVTADAMGHTTHGLAQVPFYVKGLKDGTMTIEGEPEVLQDRGPTVVWNGKRLPGIWLAEKAMTLAAERAKKYGTCTLTMREAHHIGCLAAFLPAVTEQGMIAILATSDPSGKAVAPFGGVEPVFTPNPYAMGIPTEGDPILVDISCSISTVSMAGRLNAEGRRFPGKWVQDAEGNATDDPSVMLSEPKGTLLPLGGQEYGHKGYGMALMVETLTQGLSGFGRADQPTGWQGSVFLQVLDPEAFAGADSLKRQTEFLAETCRNVKPADVSRPVRLPGGKASVGLRAAKAEGLELYETIMKGIEPVAEGFGISMPSPL
ncbi:Ldh family oxidoreductase [Rhodobacteraceae bacterium RKSG542]|uniref:Ldh family oxidoreductase n=1 Tax=Pseudovibrio flavus TaxID=2529854 RepID=UPI0012BD1F54|nr:Ldh family oxidoreductase [Pseudovibrio flavus]MTI17985.1 Ldh family oxidoreductase [Pseudovibrio flavus]